MASTELCIKDRSRARTTEVRLVDLSPARLSFSPPCAATPGHHPPDDTHTRLPKAGTTKKSPADIAKCPLGAKCAPSLPSAPQILALEFWRETEVRSHKVQDTSLPRRHRLPQRQVQSSKSPPTRPPKSALTPSARVEASSKAQSSKSPPTRPLKRALTPSARVEASS